VRVVVGKVKGRDAVREFTFGSYNLRAGGFDCGRDDRLRHQLAVLTEVGADAWAFQECTGWRASGSQAIFTAERILGMRGFVAPSHHGRDVAVFVRESAGLRIVAEQHEQGHPYWHAAAHLVIATPWPGGSVHLVSAHLAPSPSIQLGEAEALALIANDGWVIAGGDWHAMPATDPEPPIDGIDPSEARRALNRSAAFALEEAGFIDVGAHLDDLRPTAGHVSGLHYRRDRVYTTLPTAAFMNYQVVTEYEPASDHRPVVATFDITDLRDKGPGPRIR
jgi:endonuclease/exonuclease/phosphatase family metal-dependent hydrolase